MSKVISKRASYNFATLRPLVFDVMDSLGGSLIGKNTRVLIKPNLLGPASPEKAMLTHPMIVRAVSEYVLQKGAKPQISDSPAMGTFSKVLKESGIKEALQGLDVDYKEFKASRTVVVGEPFGKIEIAADALDADVVINLPKFKTHSQMLLTLGVKNLFGCIVGLRKPEWHLRAGVDREMFAMLLVRICNVINPAITILDGILAMEGNGPGIGGRPKHVGVLLGSNDPVAIDRVVCGMLEIEPEELLTNKAAKKAGLVDSLVEVEGDLFRVSDFRLPEMTPLVFGPKCFHSVMRKHLTQRPVVDDSLCKSCGDCSRYCPAGAILHDPRRASRAPHSSSCKVVFDFDICIRCYCCIEVCPHGALKAEEPMLGRIFTKIIKRTST